MGGLESDVKEAELCPKGTGEPWRVLEQGDRVGVLEVPCQGMGWRLAWRLGDQRGAGYADREMEPEVGHDLLVAG